MGRFISDKDLLILSFLRKNSRETLTKISKKTKIPVSTIFDKLKIFEKKYIRKNACLVDFSKLGYNLRSHISIRTNNFSIEKVKEFLSEHNNVNSLFKLENNQDLLVEGIFKDSYDLDNFIKQIRLKFYIEHIDIKNIAHDVVREKFLETISC